MTLQPTNKRLVTEDELSTKADTSALADLAASDLSNVDPTTGRTALNIGASGVQLVAGATPDGSGNVDRAVFLTPQSQAVVPIHGGAHDLYDDFHRPDRDLNTDVANSGHIYFTSDSSSILTPVIRNNRYVINPDDLAAMPSGADHYTFLEHRHRTAPDAMSGEWCFVDAEGNTAHNQEIVLVCSGSNLASKSVQMFVTPKTWAVFKVTGGARIFVGQGTWDTQLLEDGETRYRASMRFDAATSTVTAVLPDGTVAAYQDDDFADHWGVQTAWQINVNTTTGTAEFTSIATTRANQSAQTGVIAKLLDEVDVTNSTTLTLAFATPVMGILGAGIQANVGDVFRLRAAGNFDCKASSGSFTATIRTNTHVMATHTIAVSQTSAATGKKWMIDDLIFVDAVGAPGAVSIIGDSTTYAADGTSTHADMQAIGVAEDLSGGMYIQLYLVMNIADASNILRAFRGVIEKITAD